MGVTGSTKGGAPRELPPTGLAKARCINVIDMGTQETMFSGQKKLAHKIALTFELSETFPSKPFSEERGLEPFVLSRRFTVSTHPKSSTRPFLEGWFGRALTAEEERSFDFSTLINKAGMVNVVITPDQKDPNTKYANIQMIAPMVKGSKMVKAINPFIDYCIGAPNQWEEWAKIHEKMQEKIMLSPEWVSEATKANYAAKPTSGAASNIDEPAEEEEAF